MHKTITGCCRTNLSSRLTAIPSHRRNVLPFHQPVDEPDRESTDIRIKIHDVIRRSRKDLRKKEKVLSRKAIQRHFNLPLSYINVIESTIGCENMQHPDGKSIDFRMVMAAESGIQINLEQPKLTERKGCSSLQLDSTLKSLKAIQKYQKTLIQRNALSISDGNLMYVTPNFKCDKFEKGHEEKRPIQIPLQLNSNH